MTDDEDARQYRDLTRRPGFLIRRLHQIHLALFAEECSAFGVTPVQYSIMTAIDRQPSLDQAQLGEEVGIDRATIADVLARLEARALVSRRRSRVDARMKLVSLTARGRRLLARIDPHAQRAHARTIAALPAAQRAAFIDSLTRLVEAAHAVQPGKATPSAEQPAHWPRKEVDGPPARTRSRVRARVGS